MRAKFIHLLLIPSLLGCPLFCGPGFGSSTADSCAASRQPASCCAPCHLPDQHPSHLEPADHSEPAEPSDHEPGTHSCQCICGGAVLMDGVKLDHSFAGLAGWMAATLDAFTSVRAGVDQAPTAQFFDLQRDVGATPGRLLRCRYASLLC